MDSKKELVFILIIALGISLLLFIRKESLTYSHQDFSNVWDHHNYIMMAKENPVDFHIAPFCWRIFVPVMAKYLPFNLQLNFILISFFGVWMTGVIIYYMVRAYTSSFEYALISMLMFYSMGWAGKFVLYDFWLPDSLSFLFISLGFYSIITKKDFLFLVTLSIGVLVKESLIFLAPLYYTLNTNKIFDVKLLLKSFLIALPGILILGTLRILIPQMNGDVVYLGTFPKDAYISNFSYNYWESLSSLGLERIHDFSLESLYAYSIGTFSVLLTFTPFFEIKRNKVLLFRTLPYMFLVYSQLLFAGDTERLLVIGFPVLILLSLNGVKAMVKILRITKAFFIPLAGFFVLLNIVSGKFSTSSTIEFSIFTIYLALLFSISTIKHCNEKFI